MLLPMPLRMPLLLLIISLFSFSGCTGDEYRDHFETSTQISGVAATGAPIVGTVYVRGTGGTEFSATLGEDGGFNIDVGTILPPYFLMAEGTADGENQREYSLATGGGTANINPLTSVLFTSVTGVSDPSVAFDTDPSLYVVTDDYEPPFVVSDETVDLAVTDLQSALSALFSDYGVTGGDPLRDNFTADSMGLDLIFDDYEFDIDISYGTCSVVDAVSGLEIGELDLSDLIDPVDPIELDELVDYSSATPSAPTALTVATQSDSAILLSWEAVSGASSYRIWVGELVVATTSATSHTLTSLDDDTGYCFTVTALNSTGGESVASTQACATTNVIPGKLKWSLLAGYTLLSSPAIDSGGTVYIGNDQLFAVDSGGAVDWSWSYYTDTLTTAEAANNIFQSPVVGSGGEIYVSSGYNLYAINSGGTLDWSYDFGDFVFSTPAIDSRGTLYVTTLGGFVHAVSSFGSLKWSYDTGAAIEGSVAVASGGTIYVGDSDGVLHAIDSGGDFLWSYSTGGAINSSPAIDSSGVVYLGSADGRLYAINPGGTLAWSYDTGGVVTSSPAIGPGGIVYLGSASGGFYAINSGGTLAWSFTSGGAIRSSPAIGADGTVYVGSDDYFLYALNSDGTLKWSYETGFAVSSSPAIGLDGTIYVGSEDSVLYAIYGESGGLASSDWPMFRHDLSHSGTAQ